MQSVQTNAQKSEGRGWGDGEMRTQAPGWVGTWGPREKSLLWCWGDSTRAGSGRGGGSGRATRALGRVCGDLLCANAGQAGGGPRPRSPEQRRCARGLATHNKKLMSAAAWAAGSAVARPRGDGGCDGGQGRKRKGEKGQERRRMRRRRGEPAVRRPQLVRLL